jgi:hypothetical protein
MSSSDRSRPSKRGLNPFRDEFPGAAIQSLKKLSGAQGVPRSVVLPPVSTVPHQPSRQTDKAHPFSIPGELPDSILTRSLRNAHSSRARNLAAPRGDRMVVSLAIRSFAYCTV